MILKEILTQYKNYVYLEDENLYSQLTISNNGIVSHRDVKKGVEIGRKRQFVIDLATNPHTLIFTRQGVVEGSIGIVPKELDGYIVTENMPMFSVNTDIVNPQYLIMFLKSKEYKEQIRKIIPSGTAQKALHEDKWTLIEINLPSLKEQNQIVDKYLKCLPDLEKVSLKTSKQEKYVSSLRQAILQQAVEGKLCEQDSSDEPASVLLEKIKAEKEKLIAEKKTKKQKDLPPITEEEKPFELPQGWEWCRLGEFLISAKDGPHYSPQYATRGIPFISGRNINKNGIDFSTAKYITNELHMELSKRCKPQYGDILYTKGGETGLAVFNDTEFEFNVWVHVAVLKTFSTLHTKYIVDALNSPHCYELSQKYTHGTGNRDLGLTRMVNITVPLPPLSEQLRIVKKVDRLMALCDELEQEVTSAKKYASQLMEAVLQEAFSNKTAETKDNVIAFAPQPQQANTHKPLLAAAARGKMGEATWQRIADEAMKLASEES